MARLVVALVVLGLATAFGLPSISDLTYNPTVPNTGSLLPTLTGESAKYSLGYHRIWVPTNIQTFSVEVVSIGTDACSLNAYGSSRQFGCGSEWSSETGVTYPCQDVSHFYPYSTSSSRDFFPSSYSEESFFQLGAWFYLSVSRYYPSSEYTDLCAYTVEVTATFCPEGQVASVADGSTSTCYTPTIVSTLPATASVAIGAWNFHRFWVESSREFTYFINSTADFYVYGYSLTAPSDNMYLYYDTGSYTSASDTYLAMGGWPAEKGWFWVAFENYGSSTGTAEVMFDAPACPAGMIGMGCMYPMTNVTGVALTDLAGGVNPYVNTEYEWTFYTVSFANGTDGTYNLTVNPVTGATNSFTVFYRRNGYPTDSSSVYGSGSNYQTVSTTEGQTFSLQWQSLYAGGDFYFGMRNTANAAVNFTLTSASAVSSTTDASSTTEATTGSGAANVVASFALVAFLLALFF